MTAYATVFAGRAHNATLTVSEGSRDVAAQKVRLDWKFEISKGVNRTTWNVTGGNQPWSVVIDGVTVGSGTSFPFNFDTINHTSVAPGTVFLIGSGSHTFSVGPDGTFAPTVAFSADADVWSGGSHGSGTKIMGVASYPSSGTVTFGPIGIDSATQPVVTPKSANIADTVTVSLPRKNVAYTHDVTWSSGALSGTIGTGLGTSTTWVVPDVSAQFPTQAQSPITITAVTKNGASTIGSKSVTLLVWNSPPSFDFNALVPFDLRIRRVEWNGTRLQATNPIVVASLSLTDTASATPSLTVQTIGVVPGSDTDLDGALVLVDVQNGVSWQSTGLLFVLSRASGDDADVTDTISYSGMGYLDFVLARGYQSTEWKKPSTNAGDVMRSMIVSGQSRSWGSNIATSFTNALTSVGAGWQTAAEVRELSGGTPYSQILDALVNDGWAEWRGRYSDADGKVYLDLHNPNTGLDWTSSASQVVVNFATGKISEAPTTWSLEGMLDRVFAIGDADTGKAGTSADNTPAPLASSERTPYNANLFGYLEGWASASGQTTADGTKAVAGNALENATLTNSREFTYSAYAVSQNLLPYYTFKPGDWILIPSDRDHNADPVVMRVTQVAINKSDDDIQITVTCGDLIPSSASAATMKKLKASTGGQIAGGTLRAPIPLQSIIPAAPNFAGEGAATSVGYWTSDGLPESTITFTWLPVTTALDGVTPITVDYYEVWWRPNPSAQWALKTFSNTTSVEMDGWQVYFTAQLRVRGRATSGAFGEFSGWDEVTTVAPTASIPALAVDGLYTDGLGTIFADWNGTLGDTTAVPSYFAYMSAEISPDDGAGSPTGVWTVKGNPLQAAGTVTINPGSFGTWWVRFRAYDALGGPGVNGIAADITTSDPHIDPPNPLAPTGLTATAGSGWNAAGTGVSAWIDLSWTAPTLDAEGDPVTVVGYDIFGALTGGSGTVYLTSVSTTAARIFVEQGEEWTFWVTAASNFGGVSVLSSSVTETANAALPVPNTPSAPLLDQYAGILRIIWDGTGMDLPIKYAYASISNVTGGPYIRAGMSLQGAGEVVVPGLATGDTYYAIITTVDETGQTASSVESAGLLLNPITGITVQTSPLADTGIKMTNAALTAYDTSGNPTFILDAGTGSVWIAPYEAVFHFGAEGTTAETGTPVTGLSISSDNSSFNTFFHPSGMQIRNDQVPLSWWEADTLDGGAVNFFSPRANIPDRLMMGDYELKRETKGTGSRVVIRYKGA